MITKKVTCDMCTIERGIDNHWLLAFDDTEDKDEGNLKFYPWNDNDALDEENINSVKHICSAACGAKLITKILLTKISPREIQR